MERDDDLMIFILTSWARRKASTITPAFTITQPSTRIDKKIRQGGAGWGLASSHLEGEAVRLEHVDARRRDRAQGRLLDPRHGGASSYAEEPDDGAREDRARRQEAAT